MPLLNSVILTLDKDLFDTPLVVMELMAFRFCDSFNHLDSAQLAAKWTYQNSTVLVSGGRDGGNCLLVPPGGGYILKTLDYQSGWTVGYAMQWNGGPNIGGGWSTQCSYNNFGAHTPSLCSIGMNPDRTLALFANQTFIGYTPSYAIQTGAWYYIEIQCSFAGNPITTTATLRVNGQVLLLNVSGLTGLNPAT
jgi:hypothetical protein